MILMMLYKYILHSILNNYNLRLNLHTLIFYATFPFKKVFLFVSQSIKLGSSYRLLLKLMKTKNGKHIYE